MFSFFLKTYAGQNSAHKQRPDARLYQNVSLRAGRPPFKKRFGQGRFLEPQAAAQPPATADLSEREEGPRQRLDPLLFGCELEICQRPHNKAWLHSLAAHENGAVEHDGNLAHNNLQRPPIDRGVGNDRCRLLGFAFDALFRLFFLAEAAEAEAEADGDSVVPSATMTPEAAPGSCCCSFAFASSLVGCGKRANQAGQQSDLSEFMAEEPSNANLMLSVPPKFKMPTLPCKGKQVASTTLPQKGISTYAPSRVKCKTALVGFLASPASLPPFCSMETSPQGCFMNSTPITAIAAFALATKTL